MKLDPDGPSLSFASMEEVERFHQELSALFRDAMVQASGSTRDAAEATERSKAVFQEFKAVSRALNAMRKVLTPHAG